MSVSTDRFPEAPYVNGTQPESDAAPDPTPTAPPVEADTVTVTGQVNEVRARVVNVDKGGIARLQAEEVTITLKNGGIGAVAAKSLTATLEGSGIGAIAARKAEVKGGAISMLAATNVELKDGAKVYFDLRAGALAGVIAGSLISFAIALIRVVGRFRFARKAAV
jgi:hypothetical protein